MNNKSPLRYPGGKTRACKIIEDIVTEYIDIKNFDTLISPFFGGGSFEFFIQNKYGLQVEANDKFGPLYTFWKTLKNDRKNLYNTVKKLKPISKEQFATYRKSIMDEKDALKQASHYFAINRSSFSGATLSGGFSNESANKRFTESSINNLAKIDLSNINFYNLDFIDFLKLIPQTETSLLFLDPPYYLEEKSKLYGKDGDMHENFDHGTLFKLLNKRNNWILCYNDCDYIRKLYKKYTIVDVNWNYGMNKTKKSSEILILNFL